MTAAVLHPLAAALRHTFQNADLLEQALTHPSAARARDDRGYERLEFLGDRVLGLVIAEMLFLTFPDEQEGEIAKRHAALVRKEALASVAHSVGVASHVRMPPGDLATGLTESVLADVCEALLGALYLDGDLAAARTFIEANWRPLLTADVAPPQDAKSALQEWAQGQGRPRPTYVILATEGPAHRPLFRIGVQVGGLDRMIEATGPTRKGAEQEAATRALQVLGVWESQRMQ
jgi:ribonuclease-3